MPVVADFEDFDDELTLPVFHPDETATAATASTARRRATERLMDFTFDDEQSAVAEAAEGIFAGLVTPERVQKVEATDDRFDRDLWAELAKADLLGLAVPDGHRAAAATGWSRRPSCSRRRAGWSPRCRCGRRWSSARMPIAEFGSRAAADRRSCPVWSPATWSSPPPWPTWRRRGRGRPGPAGGVRHQGPRRSACSSGTALAVPFAHVADAVLVPAALPDGGVVVGVLDPRAPRRDHRAGRDHQPRDPSPSPSRRRGRCPTTTSWPAASPDRAGPLWRWMLDRAWTGLCAPPGRGVPSRPWPRRRRT